MSSQVAGGRLNAPAASCSRMRWATRVAVSLSPTFLAFRRPSWLIKTHQAPLWNLIRTPMLVWFRILQSLQHVLHDCLDPRRGLPPVLLHPPVKLRAFHQNLAAHAIVRQRVRRVPELAAERPNPQARVIGQSAQRQVPVAVS